VSIRKNKKISNRYKHIYHFENSSKNIDAEEEKIIERKEAASLLFDIIKICKIPFKRNIEKLTGWEVSL